MGRRETHREQLGGELGALGYLLHVSRLVTVAPPHVIGAHQGRPLVRPRDRWLTGAGDDRTQRAGRRSTTVADALELLWEDLGGLQD